MNRKLPPPSQRATFLGIVLGMAKDYGYTKELLLKDIELGWQYVAERSPATPQHKGETDE